MFFSEKTYKFKKAKAFTLIELLLVMGIIGILTLVGFSAFIIFRNSVIAGNTIQSIKTSIRDAQDKALTISADNDTSDSRPYQWVYGYSIEYNPNNNPPTYDLYKIVDYQNNLSKEITTSSVLKPNTNTLRIDWKSGANINCVNKVTYLNSFAQCSLIKSTPIEGKINQVGAGKPCSILFTSVNAIPTISGGGSSCYINVDQITAKQTLYFDKGSTSDIPSVGDIKTCANTKTSCP